MLSCVVLVSFLCLCVCVRESQKSVCACACVCVAYHEIADHHQRAMRRSYQCVVDTISATVLVAA